jgi:hypothetical protein
MLPLILTRSSQRQSTSLTQQAVPLFGYVGFVVGGRKP